MIIRKKWKEVLYKPMNLYKILQWNLYMLNHLFLKVMHMLYFNVIL